jgi:hypothetical protein
VNTRRTLNAAFAIAGILAAIPCTSQTAQPPGGYDANGLQLTIPFAADAGNAIYISVKLNGRNPRWWAVDTGASECIVDSTAAMNSRLVTRGHREIHGAGKGTVRLDSVQGPVHLIIRGLDVPTCDHFGSIDLRSVSNGARSLGGILGYEFFQRYIVQIDFAARTLKLYDPNRFHYTGKGDTIALEMDRRPPRVAVRIKTARRPEVTRHLIVDTGSEDAVDDSSVRRNPRGSPVTVSTTGLGASYEAVIGTLDTVRIGRLLFTNVPGVASDVGIVGNGIWSRFVSTFDFPHRRIFVEAR